MKREKLISKIRNIVEVVVKYAKQLAKRLEANVEVIAL